MIKPIDNIRNFFKFASVQLGIIGTTVTAFLIAMPGYALEIWAIMPIEFKSAVPPRFMPLIGVGIYVCAIIARGIKQNGLKPTNEDKRSN